MQTDAAEPPHSTRRLACSAADSSEIRCLRLRDKWQYWHRKIAGGAYVVPDREYPRFMDNDDYPRYPAEIMVMGEWLNTLAHKIIQCQRHSY
jgi:hypothetical protein